MNITLNPDGSLSVRIDGPQLVDAKGVPVVDGDGKPILSGSSYSINADQVAAHRRDPAFEAAIPAPIKATLSALAKVSG